MCPCEEAGSAARSSHETHLVVRDDVLGVTQVIASHPLRASAPAAPAPSAGQPGARRRLILIVLAAVVILASVLALGLDGLIPYGLLLAFSTGADEDATRRSVILSPRNVALAAAMIIAFALFWLWHFDLSTSTLVVIGAALIAMPLALQESAGDAVVSRTIVVTKRSLIIGLWGLVLFVYLHYAYGQSFNELTAVCVVLPLVLAASRVWVARRGQIELELLQHPLRPAMRAHLLQGLNIWLCCALLGGVLAAGGLHFARIGYALNATQFGVLTGAFAVGVLLLAALAVVPRRRVHLATNVVVALLSGYLALQLVQLSDSPADAVVLDSPLAGDWFVLNGGHSVLLNGHSPNENNAVDLLRIGTNGRTHTGGGDAPLIDYAGFGWPVLAPADGRIVEVTDDYPDMPPGTNSDHANHLVMDIGGGRYVAMAHLQQGSVTVRVGDVVRQGQQLASVGNNGHSNEPHLHLQVQDSAASMNAARTYSMVFRNVDITRGGAWPWGDSRELRTGDLVRADGR